MRTWWGAPLLVVLCGCPYNDIGAIDDAHAAQSKQEEQRYEVEDKRYAACEDAPPGATCGLLVDRVSLVEFKIKVCGLEENDDLTSECKAKYLSAFDKQLRARYPLADWHKVTAYCKGGQGRCDTLRKLELALLATHNANAEADHGASMAAMEKKQKAEREDAEDENTSTLMALGVVTLPAP